MADRVQVRCHDVRERRRSIRRSLWCICTCALTLGLAAPAAAHDIPAAGPQCDEDVATFASRVLLFTETAGARSDAIPAATAAICEVAGARGIAVDRTEDSSAFDAHLSALRRRRVPAQHRRRARGPRAGRAGGATCAAAEASPRSAQRPRPSRSGPSTARWSAAASAPGPPSSRRPSRSTTPRTPRPSRCRASGASRTPGTRSPSNPRGNVHVLAGLDETSYDAGAGAMGRDHPISWCKDVDRRTVLVHGRRPRERPV